MSGRSLRDANLYELNINDHGDISTNPVPLYKLDQ